MYTQTEDAIKFQLARWFELIGKIICWDVALVIEDCVACVSAECLVWIIIIQTNLRTRWKRIPCISHFTVIAAIQNILQLFTAIERVCSNLLNVRRHTHVLNLIALVERTLLNFFDQIVHYNMHKLVASVKRLVADNPSVLVQCHCGESRWTNQEFLICVVYCLA